ncbi:nucleotidyltransferase domain-containing protein [Paenibacillus sp. PR3]|uniref:Nucleotidyltransferase domain-containing protein n=1 Tax=Paenibacillus terricola TaxID=2763503 RepID=A0ABR8N924_9BACL|nr:nucleotidyltransferase domain-containing protein [Paenibacillus terricola]
MMLTGSHARGDAHSTSDIDLVVLLQDGHSRQFEAITVDEILVELKYADRQKAIDKLESNPMEPYPYMDGKMLFDKYNVFESLRLEAIRVFNNYNASMKERKAIHHWLRTAKIKIFAAIESNDRLKASFVTSTTSYKILEGLWMVCGKPVPPTGSVLPHIGDLMEEIPHIREWMDGLFLGTIDERMRTAIEMIDWANTRIMNEERLIEMSD